MSKALSLLLFLSLTFSFFAQINDIGKNESSYVDEDGYVRNEPLNGTVILPYTNNFLSILNSGYYPSDVEILPCSNGSEIESGKNRVDSVVETDSSIVVTLTIYDNCCYDFLWDPSLSEDGLLNLIYIGYGSYCGCTCCFGHIITFSKEFDERTAIREIRINGKDSYKVNPAKR